MYCPLWVKSNFSFLEGASHPEELISAAAEAGVPALALTDRSGFYGSVRAHVQARETGVRLIHGVELITEDGLSLVLLVRNRLGYSGLCRVLSQAHLRSSTRGTCLVRKVELWANAPGLIAIVLPRGRWARETRDLDVGWHRAFGRHLYSMVVRHARADDHLLERIVRGNANSANLQIVAGVEILYHQPTRQPLQDVMTAIRHGTTLAKAGTLLRENNTHGLPAPAEFLALFEDDVEAVERTLRIAADCEFDLGELRYRYPSERLPDGRTTSERLHDCTWEGADRRYPDGVPDDVESQLQLELKLIDELDYCGYFMTMWELVQFCKRKDILCQGRGSAANSAVCYCLGITAVDPLRMGLLFERFLSRERAEPPDIDLDIEHERREEVIQYVYQHYGRDHAAMVATVISYRSRSATREVAKALGLSDETIEALARSQDQSGDDGTTEEERDAVRGLLIPLRDEILGFPRHLSVHPGGFLLGQERIDALVPIENGAMADRTVIQWDKDDVEALGLFKVDLLGLGALSMLHRTFELVREHYGRFLTMATIPPADEAVYRMLWKADTVGLFQVESRAQMAMLPRTKPRNYYDLVIQISIIRPGPIVGGMVHPYLRRRDGEEAIEYPHPALEPILRRTLGIPLFQEQIMRLAMVAADYTPGEADQLRRDMAAWKKAGRLEAHRERLIGRMVAKGVAQEFAERVFQQISGFGEYGFPESHAASFALIAYATAWMKWHYRTAFTAALLNSQPMGFYSVATIVDDAKRHGVVVHPPDVLKSDWDCLLEPHADDFSLRMGIRYVKGIAKGQWQQIARVCEGTAPASIEELSRRSGQGPAVMSKLAEAGALRGLQADRRTALWQAHAPAAPVDQLALEAEESVLEWEDLDRFDEISWDYDSSGYSAVDHPLAPMRDRLAGKGLPTAAEVWGTADGTQVSFAGLVICRQRPGTASGVLFITLEDETGFVNLILWPKVFEKNRQLARTASLLGVTGKLQAENGVVHLIAERLWVPRIPKQPERRSPRWGTGRP